MTLRSIFLTLLLAFTATPSHAAMHYYSTFSKGNVPAPECVPAGAIVSPLIAEFHAPADWTWIVACDEPAWRRIEAKSGLDRAWD
jgi:hypothetical protein